MVGLWVHVYGGALTALMNSMNLCLTVHQGFALMQVNCKGN
jgi:hypothetical protein